MYPFHAGITVYTCYRLQIYMRISSSVVLMINNDNFYENHAFVFLPRHLSTPINTALMCSLEINIVIFRPLNMLCPNKERGLLSSDEGPPRFTLHKQT